MNRKMGLGGSPLAGLMLLTAWGCAEPNGGPFEATSAVAVLEAPQQLAREARIFASTCAHCHVGHSGGIPRAGVASDWNERETKDFDTLVQHAIEGYRDMPPLGTCSYCSRAEIEAMTALLVAGSEIVVPTDVDGEAD